MKVRRLLLFILVAVNLTLVCQGHAAGSGHTGVHLAVLAEMHLEDEEGDFTAPVPGNEAVQVHEPGHDIAQIAPESHPSSLPVEEAGRNNDPALLSGGSHFTSLSTLAVALLVIVTGSVYTFSLYRLGRVTWRSNTKSPPEPPPPRLAYVIE